MNNRIPARWQHAVLICGKCSKRAGGIRLAKRLRKQPGFGKGRKAAIGVVETSCLGLCPKRGVAIIDSRQPGAWRIVDPAGSIETLAASLGAQSSPGSATVSPSASRT